MTKSSLIGAALWVVIMFLGIVVFRIPEGAGRFILFGVATVVFAVCAFLFKTRQ